MDGRVAGIRIKGNLSLEIDQEVDASFLGQLLGGVKSPQSESQQPDDELSEMQMLSQIMASRCQNSTQPTQPYPFQAPHPYANQTRPSTAPYPVSAKMFDFPGQFLSPPQ